MKTTYVAAAVGACAAAAIVFSLLRSSPALGGDETPALGESGPTTVEPEARASYEAHLAANDAAAERWRAAHGSGTAPIDAAALDERAIADTYGCPEGTQFWQRDRITDLCATLCSSDNDCGPEDGRCRLLDIDDTSQDVPILLVDDLPADELEVLERDDTTQAPPIRVCDPFWDVEGALDADLVAAVE